MSESVTLCVYDRGGACGGPFSWAVDFTRSLHRTGVAVQVMILCPGGRPISKIADACERSGVPFVVLDTDEASFLEDQTEWILREWRKRPAKVFIANLVLPALFAARWIRRAGGKTVGMVHSNPDHDPFYSDLLNHFVAGRREWQLDAVVPVSNYICAKVSAVAPTDMLITTIPCGTAPANSYAAPPESGLRLLYCGRLVQEAKRIRELTAALLEASRMEGVTATICGDGEERAWLEDRLAGQDKVRYGGHVPSGEMPALMAQHHVIVLLSDYEGLSMALVEGMACGLVPVCLDEPSGTGEVLRDGVNGFVVGNRGESFLQAVEKLRSPDVWSRLSTAARDTVAQRYTHPVVFSRWLGMIGSLAEGAAINPRLIPQLVSLRKHRLDGAFANYPPCRPSGWSRLVRCLRGGWKGLRKVLRPRARMRNLWNRMAKA